MTTNDFQDLGNETANCTHNCKSHIISHWKSIACKDFLQKEVIQILSKIQNIMFPLWQGHIIWIPTSTFQQIDTSQETKICVSLSVFTVHAHISLLTVCLPSSRCPAWTCHPARVWSPCGYMRGSPCCATSCPPASCGTCWPAAAPCRRCNGWWSDKTTTAGEKEQRRGKKQVMWTQRVRDAG